MKLRYLRVENRVEPLGIDDPAPRFSWQVEDAPAGFMQSAWEIRVRSTQGLLWASGKVPGGESIQIPYQGKTLPPMTDCRWKVRVFDPNGTASPWSKEAHFSTGRQKVPWQGKWITAGLNSGVLQPAALIRGRFTLRNRPVRARLYVTAQGLYTAALNGKPVTEDRFTPGWTVFSRRVQYQVYDLKKLLRPGDNVLGFQLNEGWYSGMITRRWNGLLNPEDKAPALRAELRLDFADGSTQVIPSSGAWRYSLDGPVRYSDIYEGEAFDARKIRKNWDRPGFDDSGWLPVRESRAYDAVRIEPQTGPSVRCMELRKALNVTHPQPGITVLDLGQNLSGRERLRLRLKKDQRLTVLHGEMLNPDGTVYTKNLRRAHAMTYLIGSGRSFVYEPCFTFYGFRYLQLDLPDFDPENLQVVVLHSRMERTGSFQCSEPLLNRLYDNALWGQKSNYFDVPTDCPQRDERLGWTGDTQVFARAGAFNFDVENFFDKWLRDLELSRSHDGAYPIIAPFNFPAEAEPDGFAAAGWSDAGIICPYVLYRMYGDTRVLKRHYPAMKRYLHWLDSRCRDGICEYGRFGDWLNLDAPTSQKLVSTAFAGWSALLFSRIAEALGRRTDAEWAAGLHRRTALACRKHFFSPEGELLEKTQTAALLLLHFQLVPEEFKQRTAGFLVRDITVTRHNHLSTGFLGTPYLADVLADNGYREEAYALIRQETYPSWLFPVKNGATTIWERWNSWTRENGFGDVAMNSFNHYAYGAVIDWFYRRIGGIEPVEPGFKRFRIAPLPGGTLRAAEVRFRSPYGWIGSKWSLDTPAPVLEVEIPPNTQAEVCWLGETRTLGSGRYRLPAGDAELRSR